MVHAIAPETAPLPQPELRSDGPRMVVGDEEIDSQELTQTEWSQDEHSTVAAPPISETPVHSLSAYDEAAHDDEAISGKEAGEATLPDNDLPWASQPNQRSRQTLLLAATGLGLAIVLTVLGLWMFSGAAEPTVAVADVQPPKQVADPTNIPDALDLAEPPIKVVVADSVNADDSVQRPSIAQTIDTPAPTIAEPPADLMQPAAVVRGSEPINPVVEPLSGLPSELEAFTRLLDIPGEAPDRPPMRPADAGVAELRVDAAADAMIDPMMLATPPPEVNIENVMKFRVAVQTDGYPLSDFLLLCSEVTRVPIQIDWVTLDLAGVAIDQSVTDPQPGWKPIGELLQSIAASAKVVIEPQPEQLLVTLSVDQAEQRMRDVITTDDFGAEQVSAGKLVDAFVNQTQWEQREKIGLRALVTDGLRVARDLPPRLNPLAQKHWMVVAEVLQNNPQKQTPPGRMPDDFAAQWPLVEDGESGTQLDTAITLAGFLRHTARLNQSTCVVNWQDARDRRISPGQLVMPFAGDPAGTMLRKTLRPMGLNTRQASQGIWWVGTDATYDRMPLLVIGDPLGPQRDAILQRIGEAAGQAATELLMQHDPVSDRYLALMPRFLYRQLPSILKPFAASR